MNKPHKGFAKLAAFTALDYAAAEKRFHLDETDDEPPAGFLVAVSDVFGEDPEEVFVHEGNVKHEGDVRLGAVGDYAGVYVVDGDLEVAGTLELTQVDGGSILLVTGSLRAKNLAVAQEAQLWVGKDLAVAEHLLAGVSDAGGLAVKGRTSATALLVWDSEMVAFGKKPKAKVVARTEGVLDEDAFPKVLLAEDVMAAPFDAETDFEELVKALRKGKPLLR